MRPGTPTAIAWRGALLLRRPRRAGEWPDSLIPANAGIRYEDEIEDQSVDVSRVPNRTETAKARIYVYKRHLVRNLENPGLKVEDVFKRVRAAVRQGSKGRQVPWDYNSLEGDFHFRPPKCEVLELSTEGTALLDQAWELDSSRLNRPRAGSRPRGRSPRAAAPEART